MIFVAGILLKLLFAYAVLLTVIAVLQRRLMYFPEKNVPPLEGFGFAGAAEINATAADGAALHGWHIPAQPGFPTIVYFHGNAGHLGDRAEKFRHFVSPGFGLLSLSWRGFGKSIGTPTEAGLTMDANAAIDTAQKQLGIAPGRLLLYGESLGSGLAVRMAAERDVGGLVLEAPYTSVLDRSKELFFYLPVSRFLKDRYPSLDYIAKVKCPVLILHGEKDRTIPVRHGRRLLEAAVGKKRGVFYPGIDHTDFDLGAVTQELVSFAREHGLITATA